MISKAEIEIFASKIASLIGHLAEPEFNAVVDRAAQIARQRCADAEKALLRLLRQ